MPESRPADPDRGAGPLRAAGRKAVKRTLLRAASVVCGLGRRAGDAVLLTFDDGPDPDVTPAVLERLGRYGARAVFFVVGRRIPRAPWVLREIVAGGHLIGNHTHHHEDQDRAVAAYAADIGRCQEAVEALTGSRPALFRPPQGRVTLRALRAARRHRLTTVHWSVEGGDWSLRTREAALGCGEHLARVAGPGDIVLLHDDNPCVLTVLDVLLPRLAARGLNLDRAVQWLGPAREPSRPHKS